MNNADLNYRIQTAVSKAKRKLAGESAQDPLKDVPISGDVEKDSEAEVSAMLAAFKKRENDESKRQRDATDSEYWFAVCFQTRAQKEAFLKTVDWFSHGDKYLDGHFIAKKMGVELPVENLTFQQEKRQKRLCKTIPCIGKKEGD